MRIHRRGPVCERCKKRDQQFIVMIKDQPVNLCHRCAKIVHKEQQSEAAK